MENIRVFITDDHELFAEGLKELISGAGFEVIGMAHDGLSAVNKILGLRPDVILMDLDLPELNGFEVSKAVLEKWPEAQIVVITMHLEKSLIEKAIKIGVKGFLPKNAGKDEFIMCIKEISRGKNYFSTDATRTLALGNKAQISTTRTPMVKLAETLTERELEIIKTIAQGLSNREVAEKLHLSVHTVDTHRKNIMRKLEVNNAAGLIRFALQAGLVG